MSDAAAAATQQKFPKTFWTANTIELFERAAYYAMAPFMVIYLKETLGMTPSAATLLNGTVLWGLVYFLPVFSGTLADKFGYKRSLSLAFCLIALGYVIMGNLQRFWPGMAADNASSSSGGLIDYTIPALAGIVLIGIGGSIVKPCIAGTVQKSAGLRATLAFGIFYMVINIGSITGRAVCYFVRKSMGIPAIFTYASTIFAIIGLLVVLIIYREPQYVSDGRKDNQKVEKKTVGQAILGIFVVLSNIKFLFFLVVIGMFWFIYIQLYNLVPLFLRYVDPDAPVELYQLANPVMIVCFQVLITKMVKRWTPLKTIMIGAGVVTVGMVINVLPQMISDNPNHLLSILGFAIPLAGLFLIGSIALMAVGEMMASPRVFEYVGAIAPKGEEGLYTGYVSLPTAIATIVGGPVGGKLFEHYIADPQKAGQPVDTIPIWLIISAIGVASMVGLFIYDRFMGRLRDVRVPRSSYFKWEGRLNRSNGLGQALSFSILAVLFYLLLKVVLVLAGLFDPAFAGTAAYAAASAMILWPSALVALFLLSYPLIKRLHDLDMSGWYYVLLPVPLANLFLLYICFFKKGTPGLNRYGQDLLLQEGAPAD